MLKGISNINGNNIEFHGGKEGSFDAIVFATGYKSTVNTWLKVQIKIEISFTSRLLKSPNANCCGIFFVLTNRLYFCGVQNGESMLNKDGFAKNDFPDHWKGANGLYCAGFARRGLAGIAMDAKNIADDIMCIMD